MKRDFETEGTGSSLSPVNSADGVITDESMALHDEAENNRKAALSNAALSRQRESQARQSSTVVTRYINGRRRDFTGAEAGVVRNTNGKVLPGSGDPDIQEEYPIAKGF